MASHASTAALIQNKADLEDSGASRFQASAENIDRSFDLLFGVRSHHLKSEPGSASGHRRKLHKVSQQPVLLQ
jgi:hypothetical protein